MALIKCPECGREISDKAESCPGCGCPGSEFKSTVDRIEVPEENPNKCKSCGHINLTEDDYCEECGMRLVSQGNLLESISTDKAKKRRERQGYVERNEQLVEEAWKNHPYSKMDAMLELQKKGMDLKVAKALVNQRYSTDEAKQVIKDVRAKYKQERKELNKEANAKIVNSLQGLSNALSKDKTARCPKCGSTSIQYANKKLSVGRGLVGYGVAGPAGAVLGGLSSKKGYVVCLKCGKQWKI